MKILLINPPAINEKSGIPKLFNTVRETYPPLGILYVASYLESRTKHRVAILDAQVEELDYWQIGERINNIDPDIIGITVMTCTILDVIEVMKIAKDINKNIKIVLGGIHVNLFPEETINLPMVDYLILGEGEKTFFRLIENIEHKEKIRQIKGIVFKDNSRIIHTGIPPLINNLDKLPFPARYLTPFRKYSSLVSKKEPVTSMITSRGCPYQCTFCNRPHLGKIFRARSSMNVVDEMQECVNMGIHKFLFYDDTFTIQRGRVLDICDEILKRKLNVFWYARARIDNVDKEMLRKMKESGCRGISYGVEAGTSKIIRVLNKNISLRQAKHVFEWTKKEGIVTLAYFMIGSPSETKDDIKITFKIMKWLNPDMVHLTILIPLPGTQIYSSGLKKGIFKEDIWRNFARSPGKEFILPHWPENFSREELQKLLVSGYRCFYFRPCYIIKNLIRVYTTGGIKRIFWTGLKYFGIIK